MYKILDDFKRHLINNGKKDATIRAYLQTIKNLLIWIEAGTGEEPSPSNITPIDLAEYKRYLMSCRKPATVNRAIAGIRVFSSWAAGEGLICSDIAAGLRRVPAERRSPKWLDRNEQLRLIRVVQRDENPRNLAMIMLMLHGGLRVEELVTLNFGDLEISERKAKVNVRWGKGNKWRQVPLNNDARKALNGYVFVARSPKGHQKVTKLEAGKWLFPGQSCTGSHITTRAVWSMLKKYGHMAKINVTPHQLRHTFCHNLVQAGVPLDQIAILAGHTTKNGNPNLKTTIIYTHPGESDLISAVEKISWE